MVDPSDRSNVEDIETSAKAGMSVFDDF